MGEHIYDVGDTVRLSATFTDAGGTASDPETVTLVIQPPAGTSVSYTYIAGEIVRAAAGSYYCDVSVTQAGRWLYRWTSTGTPAMSEEAHFYVRGRAVT